jgi:hypothetical protein
LAAACGTAAGRYAKKIGFIAGVFVKSFFLAKISCTYTMNYLRQEKCLRDHELSAGSLYGYIRNGPAGCGPRLALHGLRGPS